MKAKIINFSTRYKVISNSGSYGDYLGLSKMGLEFTDGNDYDFIIFSLSNIMAIGGEIGQASLDGLKELYNANINNIPVLCLFLDFKTYPCKASKVSAIKNKFNELFKYDFEDYRDNWYLLHYSREQDKLFNNLDKLSGRLKIKKENYIYFNNECFWYYDLLKPKNVDKKICYIGNGRGGERNNFLSNFNSIDIFGRWKNKQILDLYMHKFNGVIKQTLVKEKLNNYFAQLITYDNIGISYKVDITRLVYTVSAGCLPIIDKRLKYLNLPEEFDLLFINHQNDLDDLLFLTIEERNNIIIKLQEYFSNKLNPQNELNKVYNIINNHGKSL